MLELDFGDQIPQARGLQEIPDERWERVRENVDIIDLVSDLTGNQVRGKAISCPFHGRDSRPSFYIYPDTNSCYCFGCPPGDNYFDPIKFVAKSMELSPVQALLWLERNYDLPELEIQDIEPEEDEEDTWLIEVPDLKDSYFKRVRGNLTAQPNVKSAKTYLGIYWESVKSGDPTHMAQVVGWERVEQLINRRALNGRH